MVLIAIDKHSRKILGYLCKNNQSVAYCCSDCDVEFTSAQELEEHMVIHGISLCSRRSPAKGNDIDTISEADIPLNVLSGIDSEKQLKMKYQVLCCCAFVST